LKAEEAFELGYIDEVVEQSMLLPKAVQKILEHSNVKEKRILLRSQEVDFSKVSEWVRLQEKFGRRQVALSIIDIAQEGVRGDLEIAKIKTAELAAQAFHSEKAKKIIERNLAKIAKKRGITIDFESLEGGSKNAGEVLSSPVILKETAPENISIIRRKWYSKFRELHPEHSQAPEYAYYIVEKEEIVALLIAIKPNDETWTVLKVFTGELLKDGFYIDLIETDESVKGKRYGMLLLRQFGDDYRAHDMIGDGGESGERWKAVWEDFGFKESIPGFFVRRGDKISSPVKEDISSSSAINQDSFFKPQRIGKEKFSLLIFDDYGQACDWIVEQTAALIEENPKASIAPATGATFVSVYKKLVKRLSAVSGFSFDQITFSQVDEYYPIERKSIHSYVSYLKEFILNPLKIHSSQFRSLHFSGSENQISNFCQSYEDKLRGKPLDLLLLGCGGAYYDGDVLKGGHGGFNEAGDDDLSQMRTRLVELSYKTRFDTAFRFGGIKNVPLKAISMGVATFLDAKFILIFISGEDKSPVVKAIVEGNISSFFPLSYLQKHPNVVVVLDKGAALELERIKTPWIVNRANWNEELIGKSVSWISDKKSVSVNNLTVADFKKNNLLNSFLESNESVSDLNEFIKRRIQKRIFDAKQLPRNKKIMIYSPHPDDDVICCGGIIQILKRLGNQIISVFAVSGAEAVGAGNTVSEKSKIRKGEAIKASHYLDIDFCFLDLPFYYRRSKTIENYWTNKDLQKVISVLQKEQPDIVFVPGELFDPRGTHRMAVEVFKEALRLVSLKEDTEIWLYRGAWGEYSIFDPNVKIVPFKDEDMDLKIIAIKAHWSQLEALFPGPDKRPFWKRAYDRNLSSGKELVRFGISSESKQYAELFIIKTQKEFLSSSTSSAIIKISSPEVISRLETREEEARVESLLRMLVDVTNREPIAICDMSDLMVFDKNDFLSSEFWQLKRQDFDIFTKKFFQFFLFELKHYKKSSFGIEILGEGFNNAYDAIAAMFDKQINFKQVSSSYRGQVSISFVLKGENVIVEIFDNGIGKAVDKLVFNERKKSLFDSEGRKYYFGLSGVGVDSMTRVLSELGGCLELKRGEMPTGKKTVYRIVIPLKEVGLAEEYKKEHDLDEIIRYLKLFNTYREVGVFRNSSSAFC